MAQIRCNGTMHTIREGDTLYELSRQYNVPLAVILRSNPYLDVYNLKIGDMVCIPSWFNENAPVTPGEGPLPLPTPSLPGANAPVTPGEGPMPLPMPSLPGANAPVTPGEGPMPLPMPSVPGNGNYPFYGVYVYVIKDTDTLEDILNRFGITLSDLLETNNLNNIQLKPGMAINIPRGRMY